MDWSNLIIGILGSTNIISLIVLIQNWRASRRKSTAESKLSEFEATQRIIEIYKTMYEDVRTNYEQRLKECFTEIELLKREVNELKKLKCETDPCDNRKQ